jgi:hypothetical protein
MQQQLGLDIEQEGAGRAPELTVLSFGAGQDSTTLLHLYAVDHPGFRARYAPKRFLVLMADTGDEHPETVAHVADTAALCRARGIEFHHIALGLGYHPRLWARGLRAFYRDKQTVGCKAFQKWCTDNLKLVPLYRFLDQWVGREYRLAAGNKRGLYAFARRYGPIRMLLGIATGEERRVASGTNDTPWMRDCIERSYPLIDLGMDRAACQRYIRALGLPVPVPSNCMLCPYRSEIELLWLHRFHPADYQEWVELEAAKLRRFAERPGKNLGVFGKRSLPEVLKDAIEKYGHLSDAQLDEHRMSHGHCVTSKY